jgi:hypothetical protein
VQYATCLYACVKNGLENIRKCCTDATFTKFEQSYTCGDFIKTITILYTTTKIWLARVNSTQELIVYLLLHHEYKIQLCHFIFDKIVIVLYKIQAAKSNSKALRKCIKKIKKRMHASLSSSETLDVGV